MDPVLYQAYAALSSKVQALSVLANNLSNSNSVGYKADRLFSEVLRYASQDTAQQGVNHRPDDVPVAIQQSSIDFAPGPIQETNDPLHVALMGEGFFVVETPRGLRYTRQGNFQVSQNGQLQTADGMPIQSDAGRIQLPNGKVRIDGTAHISVDGVEVGRLKIVDFKDHRKLGKEGNALFYLQDDKEPALVVSAPNLKQGALEGSNVSPVNQMAELIMIQREFESLQRTIQLSMNDMTQRLIDEASKR